MHSEWNNYPTKKRRILIKSSRARANFKRAQVRELSELRVTPHLIWVQKAIVNKEAANLADEVDFIFMDMCIMKENIRLI